MLCASLGRRRGGKKGQGGSEKQEVTVFRCAVCKKDFKSKGQMSNHETSKAHKKKMEVLSIPLLILYRDLFAFIVETERITVLQ